MMSFVKNADNCFKSVRHTHTHSHSLSIYGCLESDWHSTALGRPGSLLFKRSGQSPQFDSTPALGRSSSVALGHKAVFTITVEANKNTKQSLDPLLMLRAFLQIPFHPRPPPLLLSGVTRLRIVGVLIRGLQPRHYK